MTKPALRGFESPRKKVLPFHSDSVDFSPSLFNSTSTDRFLGTCFFEPAQNSAQSQEAIVSIISVQQ
jgi:hypothetical protein